MHSVRVAFAMQLASPQLSKYPLTSNDRTKQRSPTLRSILFVCHRWIKFHSTHRVVSTFLAAMAREFKVTLYSVRSAKYNESVIDMTGFTATRFVDDDGTADFLERELEWIRSHSFDLMFFPEVHAQTPLPNACFNLLPFKVVSLIRV